MKRFPCYRRKVQFADTDLAGIVHFSNILRYVEEAEHEAMFSLGVPPASKSGGFPKVHIDCDYQSPLRFGDVAEILLEIVRVGEKSVTWNFQLQVGDKLSAEGSLVTAYVTSMGKSSEISEVYRNLLNGE